MEKRRRERERERDTDRVSGEWVSIISESYYY